MSESARRPRTDPAARDCFWDMPALMRWRREEEVKEAIISSGEKLRRSKSTRSEPEQGGNTSGRLGRL